MTPAEQVTLLTLCDALVRDPAGWREILDGVRAGASPALTAALDALAGAYAGGAPMAALAVVQLHAEGQPEAARALWWAAGRVA